MKKILRLLFHPVLLTVLALCVLALLVWWIGPMVAIGNWTPLVSEWARGGLIGAIVLPVLADQVGQALAHAVELGAAVVDHPVAPLEA